ncbi:MAG: 3-isopropylmalate dehydratase [Caldilineaceae bacterium]|nr:3-isopropylmalate dehydratase [Caldilineaceae bacterium]
MNLQGRVWKYGDNVNTDVIFPGKYTYTLTDRQDIAQHALEDLDPTFAQQVQRGDILVAGRNWGCGSSREQAATCLLYNGVGAIIAESFGRIFYRNALNAGLLAIVCPAAAQVIQPGELVTIAIDQAQHQICCAAGEFEFPPFSPTIMAIIQAGGLIAHVKQTMLTQRPTAQMSVQPQLS